MTIRGKRKVKFPGGRWFVWAMQGQRVLAAMATNETEWMEVMNRYRCRFQVLHARPA